MMCYDAIMFPGNHLETDSNGLLLAFKHLQHLIKASYHFNFTAKTFYFYPQLNCLATT